MHMTIGGQLNKVGLFRKKKVRGADRKIYGFSQTLPPPYAMDPLLTYIFMVFTSIFNV